MPVTERVLIAGAGPIGLACAISARRRGLDPLVIDAGAIAESIVRYPVGMVFFTTPERLGIGGPPRRHGSRCQRPAPPPPPPPPPVSFHSIPTGSTSRARTSRTSRTTPRSR